MSKNMKNDIKTIKWDPTIFIKPPYITCPKCKKESFGVSGISSRHYSRKCKECYYPKGSERTTYFPLPELNKKVIYLDQFVISKMMIAINPNVSKSKKNKVDIYWDDLFNKLDRLVKLQLIICPSSSLHSEESLTSPYYEQLKSMYNLLSGGTKFKHIETIKLNQIFNHARDWITGNNQNSFEGDSADAIHGNINKWQNRIYVTVDFEQSENLVEQIRTVRVQIHEGLLEVFELWQNDKGKSFEDWYEHEREEYGKLIITTHENYILKRIKYDYGDRTITPEELIPPEYVSLRFHIKNEFSKVGVDENDLDSKLIEYFTSEDFKELPLVKISSMLFASLARKAASGQKRPPSRGMFDDTEFISNLLPYCDAMFLDNECHAYLNEDPLKLSDIYETEIFSSNTKEDFMEYLNDIESGASPMHMNEVRNVYGDDWPKPFREMYKY